jgi:hypothetical protein
MSFGRLFVPFLWGKTKWFFLSHLWTNHDLKLHFLARTEEGRSRFTENTLKFFLLYLEKADDFPIHAWVSFPTELRSRIWLSHLYWSYWNIFNPYWLHLNHILGQTSVDEAAYVHDCGDFHTACLTLSHEFRCHFEGISPILTLGNWSSHCLPPYSGIYVDFQFPCFSSPVVNQTDRLHPKSIILRDGYFPKLANHRVSSPRGSQFSPWRKVSN